MLNVMDCVEGELFLMGCCFMILLESLKYFTGYMSLSICSNQNVVMKCYDLHPPNPGNLACRPQESLFNSLTFCALDIGQCEIRPQHWAK